MPFSFFTKSSSRISRRLRWLGRVFQLWSAMAFAGSIASMMVFLLDSRSFENLPHGIRGTLFYRSIFTLVGSASLYAIGRSLLRRQRSGLYGAAVMIFAPTAMRAAFGVRFTFGALDGLVAIGALVLIASVWKEVHNDAVELENPDDPDDEERPLTPRNRGYGEPRTLPRERMPANPMPTTATPLPIKSQRDT